LASFHTLLEQQQAFPVDTLLPFFESLYLKGRFEEAKEVFDRLLAHPAGGPAIPLIWDVRSVFQYEEGAYAQAAESCKQAIEGGREEERVWANWGASLFASGQTTASLKAFIKARRKGFGHLRSDHLTALQQYPSSVDMGRFDPASMHDVKLFHVMVPPFPGFQESVLGTMQASPQEENWKCLIPEPPKGYIFPTRPETRVLAAVWNKHGLFLKMGAVLQEASDGKHRLVTVWGQSVRKVQRRRYVRILAKDFVDAQARFTKFDQPKTETINVSAGGIGFLTDSEVHEGKPVRFNMRFRSKKYELASVVRRSALREKGFYFVGAEFLGDPELLEEIAGLVHKRQIDLRKIDKEKKPL
jgi:hypothetical protein